MPRSRTALVALVAAMLLAASCGDDSNAATVDDGGEVVIDLSEYQFSPSTIEVTAGSTVTFIIRNQGQLRHEFMIGREVQTIDGVKDGFVTNFFEGLEPVVVPAEAVMDMDEMDMDEMGSSTSMGDMGDMGSGTTMGDMGDEHMEHGFMIMREPDEEARLTITIPAGAVGEWEFGCFVEDGAHYEKGMVGTLRVVEG